MCLLIFKGLRHANNHKSNIHFLILSCESFAVNYRPKCGNQQMSLQFPPSFVFSKLFPRSARLRSDYWLGHWRREEGDLYWSHGGEICITLQNIPLFLPWTLSAVCFGSLPICTVTLRPVSSEAFGWMRVENIDWNTSEVKNIVSMSQDLWTWLCNELSQKLFRS